MPLAEYLLTVSALLYHGTEYNDSGTGPIICINEPDRESASMWLIDLDPGKLDHWIKPYDAEVNVSDQITGNHAVILSDLINMDDIGRGGIQLRKRKFALSMDLPLSGKIMRLTNEMSENEFETTMGQLSEFYALWEKMSPEKGSDLSLDDPDIRRQRMSELYHCAFRSKRQVIPMNPPPSSHSQDHIMFFVPYPSF